MKGLLANINKPNKYETLTRGKYSIHILSDNNGREVGRSCLEVTEVKAAPPPVVETAAIATAVTAAAVVASTDKPKKVVEPVKEPEKEDDYLPCKEYEGHKINDKANNVALFKKDGQLYFVVYKENGSVRLRSEGFKTSKRRDRELSAALKNLNKPERYETISRGKYSLHILKDGKGTEVGRSCLETEKSPIPVIATTAAAATAVAAAVSTIKVEKEEVKPVVKKQKVKKAAPVVAKKVKKAAPVVAKKVVKEKVVAAAAPVVESAAGGGGFNWKWLLWLLPLLLLLLGLKMCGGCDKAASITPPPVIKTPAPTPPPAEVEKTVEAPVAPTCDCNGSSNIIFNIPSGRTAKVLTKLGTNPEFGNSHSLDAAGFYNKLKSAASNSRDKQFLDEIYKAMGYSGFGDASADQFSETRVTSGTRGNMGFSSKHRTVYAELSPTSSRDLEAFRIKAANGCDLHFMKTCGNHFFFCPN